MGFGLPWALLGLLAVAVPVIAHLLRRRDVPVRTLPTIALLRKADVASRRRVRVVDLLLLAARVALIAAAALAVAGPFVNVTLAWGDGRTASVAIVIDDSMSMSRSVSGGATPLAAAVERAREVIDALPGGSEVVLVLGGDAPRLLAPRTDDLALARARLDQVREGGARGTALSAAVELAARQLAGARHPLRRVLVLSDHAEHAGEAPARARAVTIERERVGPVEGAPNLAIASALATPDPTRPGEIAIAIEVRAFGGSAEPRVPVVVRRGATELARGEVALSEAGGRVVLHVPAPTGGDPTAEVALEPERPDALAADDRRGTLLRPVSAPRVLMVDGDPQPLGRRRLGGGGEEVRFLAQALSLAPGGEGGFVHRAVDPDAFLGTSLDDVDVVVLANVDLRGRNELARKVTEHVSRGGGLLVAAGDHVGPGAGARLESLLPARIVAVIDGEVVGMERGDGGALLPAGPTGLEGVRSTRRLALEPRAGAVTVLAWPDHVPALVLDADRRVALLGTALDDAWSDLPYRPGFLPLAVRVLRALAPPGSMPDAPFSPGHAPELRAPAGATELLLISPGGRVIERSGADLARPIDLDALDEPGAWRVQVTTPERTRQEAPRSAFVIAPPLAESDLTLRPLDGEASAPRDEGAREGAQTVVRRSIAPWFFALVGLLAVAEGVLRAARAQRERGARPSA